MARTGWRCRCVAAAFVTEEQNQRPPRAGHHRGRRWRRSRVAGWTRMTEMGCVTLHTSTEAKVVVLFHPAALHSIW